MNKECKYISYKELCDRLQNLVFGYPKLEDRIKNNIYMEILAGAEYADEEVSKMLREDFGFGDEIIEAARKADVPDEIKDGVNEIVGKIIQEHLKDKSLKNDGYCLKITLLHRAVQMKRNEDMLGFITDVDDENTRFVFVDFGDECGPVKIDIDELNVTQ